MLLLLRQPQPRSTLFPYTTLFRSAEPTTVLARLQEPWLRPQTYEDTHGLVSNVTFVEGLVKFRGKWFAYYGDRKSTRLNSSHVAISYAVFCLKKKKTLGRHHDISP